MWIEILDVNNKKWLVKIADIDVIEQNKLNDNEYFVTSRSFEISISQNEYDIIRNSLSCINKL